MSKLRDLIYFESKYTKRGEQLLKIFNLLKTKIHVDYVEYILEFNILRIDLSIRIWECMKYSDINSVICTNKYLKEYKHIHGNRYKTAEFYKGDINRKYTIVDYRTGEHYKNEYFIVRTRDHVTEYNSHLL